MAARQFGAQAGRFGEVDVVVRVLHDAVALLQREGDPGLIVGVREICERLVFQPLSQEERIFQGIRRRDVRIRDESRIKFLF